jgi:hypothetical protein
VLWREREEGKGTYIASEREAGDEQVASLLVMANLLQRLGARPPSVRLPRSRRRRRSSTSGAGRRPVVAP